MASYCTEKFESEDGVEQIVCWRQDKHVHEATLITTIEKWLGQKLGGTWSVRAGSYQSNQSACPQKSISYP